MLAKKIDEHSAVVGIIGLGYVGLPLARSFCDAGFKVLGFDTDPGKIDLLSKGQTYLRHIPSAMIRQMREQGFQATDDFSKLGTPDVIIICVPTPLTDTREPDLRFVVKST